MFHGQRDEAVPVSFSRKVLSVFTNAKKRMVVIKNGDHSLSNKLTINKMLKEFISQQNDKRIYSGFTEHYQKNL